MSSAKAQRRETFCTAFLETGDATVAYQRAFKPKTTNTQTLYTQAYRILHEPQVQARIAELREQAARRAVVKASDVLMEAARIAFSDIRRAFKHDGTLKALHEMDDHTAAAIASVKVRQIGTEDEGLASVTEIRLWDKCSAIDKLMKNMGLYKADNEQKGDELPQKSNEALTEGFAALRQAFSLILREPAGTA